MCDVELERRRDLGGGCMGASGGTNAIAGAVAVGSGRSSELGGARLRTFAIAFAESFAECKTALPAMDSWEGVEMAGRVEAYCLLM